MILLYDKMPKYDRMLKVKMTFCPSMTNCPKDIMPKMTTCPQSQFVQGDKLSLRRHHLCISLQNAYKFGQKLADFGQFQFQTHHYFFGD